jgi:arylsulfatase A-like enzyme
LIFSDDLRPVLGSYGDPVVQSPNIDRLAAAGVRFERAYAQAPLCNPSRVSMLLGRYPSSTGVRDNRRFFRDLAPGSVTLPQYFRRHGYVAARAGKIFHGGLEDDESFDKVAIAAGAEGKRESKLAERAELRDLERDPTRPWKALVSGGTRDDRIEARAIELLERYRDRPFFLGVGFLKPHTPFVCPKRYFDLYDPRAIELPPDFAPHPTLAPGVPAAALAGRNRDLFDGVAEVSRADAQAATAAYYACVSALDANVGRVLEALDRLQLRERTIVVFVSDHGFHLGEKGKWSKHGSLFEVGLRVPLVIAGPGIDAGGVSPRVVELVDLFPTLVELAGLPLPAGLEGQSLVPLLREPHAAWEQPARSETSDPEGRSLRTERWRYSEWPGAEGGALLFDEEIDPGEERNLAGEPDQRERIAELRARLPVPERARP